MSGLGAGDGERGGAGEPVEPAQSDADLDRTLGPLFEVPTVDRDKGARIAAYADARLDLYETIGPIARLSRILAGDRPHLAETLADTRRRFVEQVRSHFAADLQGRPAADAKDRVALIDALTSFESWDLLHGPHDRSRPQIRRAWVTGIGALLGRD